MSEKSLNEFLKDLCEFKSKNIELKIHLFSNFFTKVAKYVVLFYFFPTPIFLKLQWM